MTQQLSLAQIHAELGSGRAHHLTPLNIAVLRNVTVEPIEPYLRYFAQVEGFNASVTFGRFDSIVQDAIDPNGPLWQGAQPDIVLVFARLDALSPPLASSFPLLSRDDVTAEVDRVREFVDHTLGALRTRTSAPILWHGFEMPPHPALGILDSQSEDGQLGTIRTLNAALKERLKSAENAYFVDLDRCVARVGHEHFIDSRYWHIGRAPYTRQALEAIANEDMKFVRALTGRARKCLVLDCDDVLWGGIIGEDGIGGIALSHTHPGSAYYEFQQELLSLHHRGVILALCSRNNEQDVWEVFDRHPDMVLKREHISAAQISWDDKAAGIAKIAEELNVGLNSVVFVDDSAFEIERVREALPEVAVIHMPRTHATEFKRMIGSCGLFDTLVLSQEDRQRSSMYRAEAGRKTLMRTEGDLSSYLSSLGLRAVIDVVHPDSLARAAQLTQRTNQFNLTTKRYAEDTLRELAGSDNCDVITLEAWDRFGPYGIVGVSIVRYEADAGEIDTFLLSCRAFGRGLEEAALAACLKIAQQRGVRIVHARYVRTAKNTMVKNFYADHGFAAVRGDESDALYSLELQQWREEWPDHIELVACPMTEIPA